MVETVEREVSRLAIQTVVKYKASDGKEFDTEKQALDHEKALEELEIQKINRAERLVEKYKNSRIIANWKYPRILTAYGKHDDANYIISNESELLDCCTCLIRERMDEFYYDDDTLQIAEKVIETNSPAAVWAFLESRSPYEYENVRCEEPDRWRPIVQW